MKILSEKVHKPGFRYSFQSGLVDSTIYINRPKKQSQTEKGFEILDCFQVNLNLLNIKNEEYWVHLLKDKWE